MIWKLPKDNSSSFWTAVVQCQVPGSKKPKRLWHFSWKVYLRTATSRSFPLETPTVNCFRKLHDTAMPKLHKPLIQWVSSRQTWEAPKSTQHWNIFLTVQSSRTILDTSSFWLTAMSAIQTWLSNWSRTIPISHVSIQLVLEMVLRQLWSRVAPKRVKEDTFSYRIVRMWLQRSFSCSRSPWVLSWPTWNSTTITILWKPSFRIPPRCLTS